MGRAMADGLTLSAGVGHCNKLTVPRTHTNSHTGLLSPPPQLAAETYKNGCSLINDEGLSKGCKLIAEGQTENGSVRERSRRRYSVVK